MQSEGEGPAGLSVRPLVLQIMLETIHENIFLTRIILYDSGKK
jgi:hypothetical protein